MNTVNSQPRRKLILWVLGIAASVPLLRLALPSPKKKTVKLLSQDGKLVEVEVDNLPPKGKKIGNEELRNWVKR